MAGKLVGLLRVQLVAAVVEKVGEAPHADSVRGVDQQRVEGFQVGGAPVEHDADALLPVQLVGVHHDVHDLAVDGNVVHGLGEHAHTKHALGDLTTGQHHEGQGEGIETGGRGT